MNITESDVREWLKVPDQSDSIQWAAIGLRNIHDPLGRQSPETYKPQVINALVPRLIEVFKTIQESLDAGLDLSIVHISYVKPPYLDYVNLEYALVNLVCSRLQIGVDGNSPVYTRMIELHQRGIPLKAMTEADVGYKGLAELRFRWQPDQREKILERLNGKRLVEIAKKDVEERIAKEKTEEESRKRAKEDELASYQRKIAEYREKKVEPTPEPQQPSEEPSADILLDDIVSIREELKVLRKAQSVLASRRADTSSTKGDISELKKKLLDKVSTLKDALTRSLDTP